MFRCKGLSVDRSVKLEGDLILFRRRWRIGPGLALAAQQHHVTAVR
jgi:hypothetical protein